MFILNSTLQALENQFNSTKLGINRSKWFTYIILAFISPFTTSISSNLLRYITTLFGKQVTKRSFYTFLATNQIPWNKLWSTLWDEIPEPKTEERILVALDDSNNPKTGKKIFGCSKIFDHAAKINQSKYPFAQNIVMIGLLKQIKNRWACLPLAFKFYLPQKEVESNSDNMKIPGKETSFQTKLGQAVEMLTELSKHYIDTPILVVCDSWFGNNGLFRPLRKQSSSRIDLLSRLRSNSAIYDFPLKLKRNKPGRPPKYGTKFGSCSEMALMLKDQATSLKVNLYGKKREVQVFSKNVILKTLKCEVHVVWVFRKTQWIALYSTDLSLSVTQIVEYYGARWKIESGFKEIKQDIGSSKSQNRNAHSVVNHLNFALMATTITWIYGAKMENAPNRRHHVKGRNSFAFSDLRHLIAKDSLNENFKLVCDNQQKLPRKSFVQALIKMAA